MKELGFLVKLPISMHCDNQESSHFASNHISQEDKAYRSELSFHLR